MAQVGLGFVLVQGCDDHQSGVWLFLSDVGIIGAFVSTFFSVLIGCGSPAPKENDAHPPAVEKEPAAIKEEFTVRNHWKYINKRQ